VVFTYAKVDRKLYTAFIVEQDCDSISVDEEEEKMGMYGTSTRAYHSDNVRVPMENVLAEVGKGHLVALNALNMSRSKLVTSCVGGAKRAFFEAVKYAKQRVQLGRPICEFRLIKEKTANMAIRLFAVPRPLPYLRPRKVGLLQVGRIGKNKDVITRCAS